MWELRWVLLGLGALLVVALYLWGRGLIRYNQRLDPRRRARTEPRLTDDFASEPEVLEPLTAEPDAADLPEPPRTELVPPPLPERVVAIRFVPRDHELASEQAVLALRAAGLKHGRYGIFHHMDDAANDEASFSVANLTEPGSFDLTNLSQTTIPGMSFFMVLPGTGDPVSRFDAMVTTARTLASELDAELFDDGGSSWSIQRERYLREEMIEYRHQLERR